MIEVNDADIIRIEKGPMAWMQSKQASSMDLEDFRRTAIDKFAEIGFVVNVKVYDTTQNGMYAFELEVLGRNHYAKEFDPDQMAWEVRNNILELPDKEAGVIKVDKGMAKALLTGDRPDVKPHSH